MRTMLRSKVTLLFMMLGLLLAVPAVAFAADGLVADADTISGDQPTRTFAGFFGPGAEVKVGTPLAKPGIDFYVDCNGNSHFNSDDQASITFNAAGSSIKDSAGNLVTGAGSGSLSATNLTNISGPTTWPADGSGGTACNGVANAKLGTSEVTIVTPDTSGTYTYTIAYTATRGTGTASNELDTNVTNLPGGTSATDPDKVTFTLTVDADDPTIDLRTPAADAVYNVNDAVTVDYDCADPGATDTPPTGSGIKDPGGCVGTDSHDSSVNVADGAQLDTSTPGNYSFTVNAEDNVGNTATVTHNYTVVAPCSFSQIRPPVNDVDNATDTGMSAYKAGSKGVIPAKFQATCDGSLVDTQAEADANPMTLSLKKLGAGAGGTDLELETPVTGSANTGNLFRFDDAADQYIYNINIKSLTAGTYSITISDGSGSQTEWFVIK